MKVKASQEAKLPAALPRVLLLVGAALVLTLFSPLNALAQTNPCPRFTPGSTVSTPPMLYSQNGALTVNLSYNTATDPTGITLYCFTTPNGTESPTLVINPGDTVTVIVKNNVPEPVPVMTMGPATNASSICGASTQDTTSVNVHYHGTNISPACGSDNVIHTLINSGQTFTYTLKFPADEPPGLYWYHPHVHGLAEQALLGGASGAIVVQGIQNLQPAVAGLPTQVFVIRDQNVNPAYVNLFSANNGGATESPSGGPFPGWDLSVNYVPVLYRPTSTNSSNPNFTPKPYVPAQLQMKPGQTQFWRISNSCSDTILDLQLVYDGAPQTIQIAALDGVPTGSQDGQAMGTLVPATHVRVPPASRVEFIMTGPSSSVKNAVFLTQNVPTGTAGDNDPQRPLIAITPSTQAPNPTLSTGMVTGTPGPQRFSNLATAAPNKTRQLYFSEDNANQLFFITVQGQTPKPYSSSDPPSIVTTQGSVEDWTIQNQTNENHEFHFHQIHFLLMAINGVAVPPAQQQYLDMIEVPNNPNADPTVNPPNVTVRMDFRGADIGEFVYHCHILNHEDHGMMAIIKVCPSDGCDDSGDNSIGSPTAAGAATAAKAVAAGGGGAQQ